MVAVVLMKKVKPISKITKVAAFPLVSIFTSLSSSKCRLLKCLICNLFNE